jgi:hypothetical protein
MDTEATLEALAKESTVPKVCAVCRRVYTELDNLTLPCFTHPGELVANVCDPGVCTWTCCAGGGDGRSTPCTQSAHSTLPIGGRRPPTVVVIRGVIVADQYEASRTGAVVVRTPEDLERARRLIGPDLEAAPWYAAVARYVDDVTAHPDACSYYLPGADDAPVDAPAGAPQRSLSIVVARSRWLDSQPSGPHVLEVRQRLLQLAKAGHMHVVRQIARYSPDRNTAEAARSVAATVRTPL